MLDPPRSRFFFPRILKKGRQDALDAGPTASDYSSVALPRGDSMSIKRVIIAGTAVACMTASLPAVSADAEKTGAAGGGKAMAKSQGGATGSAPAPRRSRATEDARHCLKAGDNRAIIRCAEDYR